METGVSEETQSSRCVVTCLADLKLALEALAGELCDHGGKGEIWRTQSPLFHLLHARDHLIRAVHLIETHGPLDEIATAIRHGQTRATMACQRFCETQAKDPSP
jgi:hypothetical protein